MDYIEKLKSRKFQAFLGGMLLVLGAWLTKTMTPYDALNRVVVLVLGYLGAEAYVDGQRSK